MWCPVRALKYYWHRTKTKRSGDQLFVIAKEPFFPASRDTISKWIVAAIRAAGSEPLAPGNAPHAHDTRSVSTSWALFSGVSVEEFHRAAYWRSPNSFISFYLRDIPAAEPSFSRAALFRRGSVPLVRYLRRFSAMPPFSVCVGLAYFEQIGGRMY